ncbi:Uncharacterized conserved protein YcbK, DUF882 family [Nitrosomonas sp. Nm51]|uniref:DUF882 domain-containing protein n=1 Tax=Nitrosomonas sp. Nm51 TaxID=133720 RepID=UPI0008C9A0A6|nr:DUF882 domain-containing protein [Nitrosomonas sp. Nm51]SEQ99471.1 Uncharacterized conserved protein YcbK, DUF882 family [Nitrosomonas sp. Nm51]
MSTRLLSQIHSASSRIANKPGFDRRHFLKAGIGACALLTIPHVHAAPVELSERKLAFLNLHTGERIDTTYWAQGRYISEGLTAIDNVLRDHRSGETYEIDRNLLDMLQLLSYRMSANNEFHVISGYRSPATNAQLSARSNGVAKRSLHMQGKAIDLRMPGRLLSDLHNAALSLQAGGVGYYPKSDFIHIDTGHVRQWKG